MSLPPRPNPRAKRLFRPVIALLVLGMLLGLLAYGPARALRRVAAALQKQPSAQSQTRKPSPVALPTQNGHSRPNSLQANGRIAFVSDRSGGQRDIYLMDADGGNVTPLTGFSGDDYAPDWSPDGQQIVYTSDQGSQNGSNEICIILANRSGGICVSNNPASDHNPVFSPDGSRIAFTSNRDGNEEIYVMNADGTGQTRLTNNPADDRNPAFSPDGSKIAFVSNRFASDGDIYVMKADGSAQTRLTTNLGFDPSFSPDGRKIVYTANSGQGSAIGLMNADGTNQTLLTNNPASDRNPVFSPDGSKIVFASDRDGNEEIYVMNPDGSGQTNITNSPSLEDEPAWQTLLSCTPPPTNGVAWYRAEGNANDSFGTNNGTLQNGATFAPGFVGQAFSLDGVDDYANVPFAAPLSLQTAVTLDAWIKPTTLTAVGNRVIAGQHSSYQLVLKPDGKLNFSASFGGAVQGLDSINPIPANSFVHVAGSYDAGTGFKVYINGVLDNTLAQTGAMDSVGRPFQIGGFDDTGFTGAFFSGLIDEVDIYSRALSATEVKNIYDAKNAGKCQGTPTQTITASNTNDSGPGSLRQAILDANASPGTQTITFNIPGSGVHTISLTSALPNITDPVIIDGYTQPGASQNTQSVGSNAVLLLELNGAGADGSGLTISAGNSTVRGLVINRFTANGILLQTNDGNVITGNFIGTNAAGTAALGNSDSGVTIISSAGNQIGGTTPADRNVISGNGFTGNERGGILIGNAAAGGSVIQGNLIGTGKDGVSDLGNRGPGVGIISAAGNIIGGPAAGAANTIAFNKGSEGAGVRISNPEATGNLISSNSIHSNVGLGIDFNFDGVTPNDTGDGDTGPNNQQNFPVLTSATGANGQTQIQGTLNSTANTTYNIQFFANPTCDASGNGEGRFFLGSTSVATDGAGNATINATMLGAVANGFAITATATDPNDNTSEFSACSNATSSDIVVTNTNDSGAGSLRQAILDANAGPGTQTIAFNIAGAGVHTISPTAVLPDITDTVIIDGYTQPGTSPNTLAVGDNAVLLIELDGGYQGFDLLHLMADNNVIRGLVINRASFDGIQLDTANGGNVIEGNFIGTDPTGTIVRGNNRYGVSLFFFPTANNQIGGTTPAARNLISGNGAGGVGIGQAGSTNNIVRGNYIGTTTSGIAALGNAGNGVGIFTGAANNVIGGATAAERNVISGNGGSGVLIDNAGTTNNVVRGNYIGTTVNGTTALGNNGYGVGVGTGATGNSILSNAIFANNNLGIELTGDGVTPNDAGDGDTGANNLQNFPVVTSAIKNGGNTNIQGALNSTPNTNGFVVEFFASPSCDPSGNGEGQRFLGTITVNTDASGNAAFNPSLATATVGGEALTATATDPAGNTSEFSQCRTILSTPQTFSVTNTNDSGDGSLRQAIIDANTNSFATDTIAFQIAGAGVHTIAPTSALPDITDPAIIDGYTQAGASVNTLVAGDNAVLQIELNGAGAGANVDGLRLVANNSIVRGLAINRFSRHGVSLVGATGFGDNITVSGNFLGTDATGLIDLGNGANGVGSENGFGQGSDNALIGGTTPAARNIISGNNGPGMDFSFCVNGVIRGNFIGLAADGTTALGNSNEAIRITSFTGGFMIGGDDAADGTSDGVVNARNYISGNGGGIFLGGGDTIQGNYIGTDVTGTLARPNNGGIGTNGSTATIVGGASAGAGNLISGNNGDGIGVLFTDSFVIKGNRIGTKADGVSALGNTGNGVAILVGSGNTQVGGTAAGEGNIIAFNGLDGVVMDNGTNNRILSNSIYANGTTATHLGIDLGTSGLDGVTPNDAGDGDTGPNNLQNFPVITSANSGGGITTITGTLNSTASTTFNIQFFANAACDASGNGEGQTFLGSTSVTTDASGNAAISATLASAVSAGQSVTATATDPNGNTSEFSQCFTSAPASCVTPPANLASWYPGDGDALDISGNNNNGTLTNGATFTAGIVAQAFDLDGADDYVDIGQQPQLQNVQAITVMAWVKKRDANNFVPGIIGKWDGCTGCTDDSFLLYNGEGGSLNKGTFVVRLDDDSAVAAAGTTDIPLGQWVHIAATWRSSDGQTVIYKNGVVEGTGVGGQGRTLKDITGYTAKLGQWGNHNGDPNYHFSGQIDEAMLLNRALTQAEIQAIVNAGSAGACKSPASVFTVTNTNDSGAGSLRQAIIDSNSTAGTQTIAFQIAGAGVHTIAPTSALPDITDPAIIDGYTQAGASVNTLVAGDNAVLQIELNGTNAGAGVSGLRLAGNGSTVRGLVINRFTGDGITLDGSSNNIISGNFIGTDPTGLVDLGNDSVGIKGRFFSNAGNNIIGGLTPAARNIIAGNGGSGIEFTTSTANVIQGNFIGLGANGTTNLGNTGTGIVSGSFTSGFIIGGDDAADGTSDGVVNARNYISGNGGNGIFLGGSGFDGVTIQGNYIGTDVTGTLARANSNGIDTNIANNALVGGVTAGAGNLISGNTGQGIAVSFTTGFTIKGNRIGTRANGTSALGNGANGIFFNAGPVNTQIGGVAAGEGNIIAFNGGDGVQAGSGTGNSILSNSIHDNGTTDNDLGIDLGPDGITPNDAGDGDTGANNLQNHPVVTAAISQGSNTVVQGTLNSTASTTFTLQFFSNPTCGSGSSGPEFGPHVLAGNREGQTFLGSTSVTTDASGNASFNTTLASVTTAGQFVTATATDPNGNTSEYSACQALASMFTCTAPPANMVAWYPLDGNALDIQGANHGTILGSGHQFPVAKVGTGFKSGGAGSVILVNDADSLDVTQLTLDAWIRVDGINATTMDIVDKGDPNGANTLTAYSLSVLGTNGVSVSPGGTISGTPAPGKLAVFVANGSAEHILVSSTVLPTNVFTHVAATADGATLRLYINGQLDAQAAQAVQPFNSAQPLQLGGLSGQPLFFNGVIDEVEIFGRALTQPEIQAINNADAAGKCRSAASILTVTNTNDSGAGSLRQAILDSNANTGPQTIAFQIAGAGVHTISPTSALPNITDPVIIDGYTQPGASVNTLANGDNAVLQIELDGTNAGAGSSGLLLTGGNATVRGLVINRFAAAGILSLTNGVNVITGNFIGTNAAGTAALGNGQHGVAIDDNNSNTIGGATPAARNVISGNGNAGIFIIQGFTGGGANNIIIGNFLGTDATGTADLGNANDGVNITSGANNTVGGATAAERNIISGNNRQGILFTVGATGNVVKGNYIGTNAAGTATLANAEDGIFVQDSPGNQFGGTAAGEGNLISGNNVNGLEIGGANATGNQLQGNFIGTNAAGTAVLGNGGDGVFVNVSPATTIGGNTAAARNVVSGNGGSGIVLSNNVGGSQVSGNFVGTNAAGTAGVGNVVFGLVIAGSSNNIIGGTTAAQRNIVSGNGSVGIYVTGDTSTGNVISGNYAGTDVTGTVDLGNTLDGINLESADNNTIGGTTGTTPGGACTGACNLLSGNTRAGLFINSGGNGNTVQGNYVGINVNGTAALGNAIGGVGVQESSNNAIGGTTTAARNVISGNQFSGVSIFGQPVNATGNSVQGNYIGTNAAGTAAVANSSDGVQVIACVNTTIGGTAAGAGNLISGNNGNGVSISQATATGNLVQGNAILANVQLGIDLDANGVTPNDLGDGDAGANNLQNFPVFTSATSNGGNTAVTGTLNSEASKQYRIEFFANATCDVSGNGEGQTFLGSTTVNTDASGNAPFNPTLASATSVGQSITATATDANGNTSEFSQCFTVTAPSTATLGNYANTSVPLSANTTITPDAAPTNTTRLTVSTSTNFKGKLEGDPTTGIVRVTDAHPAGVYTVTVTAFDGADATTQKTFTLTVTTPAVTCSPVSFAAATNFAVATAPNAVAVGDFNGDGKQDLVSANQVANNVSILLGNDVGGFGAAANFGVGAQPRSVAVGDFNGDGRQDLVTANTGSDDASVLLGDGAGNFGPAANFGASTTPRSVAIGDFNGDGKQDIVVANEGANDVSVLLGDGAGSFSAATNFGVGNIPRSVAVGDFNSDGKQDLVTANSGTNDMSVLLGDGTGGFGAATSFGGGPNSPIAVVIGDFNSDGKQDLFKANFGGGNVSVLLGDGAGNFGPATNFSTGTNSQPISLAIGDFNGDGQQDVSVAKRGTAQVEVFLGDSAGGFSSAGNSATGSGVLSVAVGDFNGDGKQDLATANQNSNNVSVLLRQCTAQTFMVTNTNDSGAGSLRQAILDANGNIGTDTIAFQIAGAGVHTIAPLSVLPTITDPVIIDGYTQPGAAPNTLAVGDDAVLNIQITGNSSIQGAGLTIIAANCVIKGLVVNNFNQLSGGLGDGSIEFNGAGATGGIVQGCFLGTDVTGLTAVPSLYGILIIDDAQNNTIGGTTPAARNIISGNQVAGVGIGVGAADNGLSNNNIVQGNIIGADKTGTAALANSYGVFFQRGAANNQIGGTAAGAGNIIAFNTNNGVVLSGGGAAPTNDSIRSNSIHDNGALGIDLSNTFGGDGVTANDAGDGDTGANDLQNFPVLTAAVAAGGNTTITGTLNSTASTQFTIEFFSNPTCDASGNGEGQTFLGSTIVTTDASGNATFNPTLASATSAGQFITATTTDPNNSTSEFSVCQTVTMNAASTVSWINAAGGNWNNAANWQDGAGQNRVPGAGDDALITLAGTYTVTLDVNPAINSLTVGGSSGTQTFDQNTSNLTLAAASTVGANGVFTQTGTLSGVGDLNVSGQLNYRGTMAGTGTTNVLAGATFVIDGSLPELSRRLNNATTAQYNAATRFVFSGGTFNNLAGATFDVLADKQFLLNSGTNAFNNAGTFRKATATGTLVVNIPFNNTGTVDLQAGTLNLGFVGTSSGAFNGAAGTTLMLSSHNLQVASSVNAPTVNLDGVTTVAGTFNVSGTTTINAGSTSTFTGNIASVGTTLTVNGIAVFNSNAITADTINLSGVIAGSAAVNPTATGTFNFNVNGNLQGTGTTTIPAGATLNIGGFQPTLSRTLNNAGTANYQPISDMFFSGGTFNNQAGAVFEVLSNRPITQTSGTNLFSNAGTVSKQTSAGEMQFSLPFNNSGTVDLQTGTLTFSTNGTSTGAFNGAAGTVFNFTNHALQTGSTLSAPTVNFTGTSGIAGTYNVNGTTTVTSGTTTFTGNVQNVGTLLNATGTAIFNSNTITVATINLNGTIGGSAAVNPTATGTFNFNGTLSGTGTTTIPAGATLSIGGANPTLARTLNNSGTATYQPTNGMFFGGGTLNNLNGATFNLVAEKILAATTGTNQFNNAGTVRKSAGAGTVNFNLPVANTGTFEAQAGTVQFSTSYTQTAGMTFLNGGSFSSTAGQLDIQGGELRGAGTITGNVRNGGTFNLGNTLGCLNVNGNYVQTASGTLNIEVGGTNACTQFDQLNVTGNVTLAGTLNATAINGFNPTGQPVQAITYGSRTGTFTTVTGPFTPTYGASGVTLAVPAAISADLALTQTDTPDPVTDGNSLTYIVTITNNGPSTATGVTLTDALPSGAPAGVTINTITPTQGSCSQAGNQVTCNLGTLNNGGTATVTIQTTATGAGQMTATANVTASETDPNNANNTATTLTTVQSATCVAPPANMLAWYPGDGNANDIQSGNNGTPQNGATFTTGRVGQAFSFDGVDDAVQVPATALNGAYAQVTIDAWVFPLSHAIAPGNFGRTVISKTETDGFALRVRNGFVQADLRLTGGDVVQTFPGQTTALPLNQWSHIAITYNGAQIQGYVNGASVGSVAGSGTIRNSANNSQCVMIGNEPFGCTPNNNNFGWHGQLDEIEFFNRALSSVEVQAIYNAGSAGKCKSAANILTVTNTNNSGPGSLRQAILDSNANAGTQTVNFQLAGPGIQTITLSSALPTITDPVIIDGYTQPGASANTLAVGDNAVLLVELNGANTGGLVITGGNTTIRGLVINRFNFDAISLQAGGNTIQGNFIGTNATGTAALGNSGFGVQIQSANNVIGGTTPAARNLISGNGSNAASGIQLVSAAATSNVIVGNYIGTNAAGTAGLRNNLDGVEVSQNASGNTIGGGAAGAANLIAFNGRHGVRLVSNPANNLVQGNVITGNAANGIDASFGGTGNLFDANSINSNGQLGIDLSPAGVTPNDVGDPDTGPNNLQNFPVLTFATTNGGNTTIQGTLNSTANTQFNLQFFGNPTCDASGNGEGQTFLGSTTVMTDENGNGNINTALASAVSVGQVVTATATDPGGNTSEFSACVAVTAPSQTFTISGRLTDAGNNSLAGATVNLSGAQTGTTTTDAGGNYSFTVNAGGNYTVTPSANACNTFAPPSQTFNALNRNQTANFTATLNTFTISGRIADALNNGINGVSLSLTGAQTLNTTTDANGNYSITGVGCGGSYTLTPAKSGYVFNPMSTSFNGLSSNQTANFTGTLSVFTPTGAPVTVTVGGFTITYPQVFASGQTTATPINPNSVGAPPTGVTVFTNAPSADLATTANTGTPIQVCTNVNTISDAATFANLKLLHGEGGALLDRTSSVDFNTRTVCGQVASLSPFVIGLAMPTGTQPISGRIVDSNGAALAGVTVSLIDANVASEPVLTTQVTDANGNYFFNANAGGDYRVMPAEFNVVFIPAAHTFLNLSTSQTGNFVAQTSVNIMGALLDEANHGITGVTMVLTGTVTRTTQTTPGGRYLFTGLPPGGHYTVLPEDNANKFTPERTDVTNLINNQQLTVFKGTANPNPTPTPPISSDFSSPSPDPKVFSLGILTQPPGSTDPLVTIAQQSGKLVITPRTGVTGSSFNGLVTVDAVDFTNATASVEVERTTDNGAQTIFAIGADELNYFRFVAQDLETSTTSAASKQPGVQPQAETLRQLIFQVRRAGVLTPLGSTPLDPALMRFWRYRHNAPTRTMFFETSPTGLDGTWTERARFTLPGGVGLLAAELSAGTSGATPNPGQAIFDNLLIKPATTAFRIGTYRLTNTTFRVNESVGSFQINVERTGDTSGTSSVAFATDPFDGQPCNVSGGKARARCDYQTNVGRLVYAPGETNKLVNVFVTDDSYVEGDETFRVALANPSENFGIVDPRFATIAVVDNEQGPQAQTKPATQTVVAQSANNHALLAAEARNPINTTPFFVRQQYLDFLQREPEADGFNAWVNVLTNCAFEGFPGPGKTGSDPACDRVNVSGAFFGSPEFREKGYFIYRFYKATLPDAFSGVTAATRQPSYEEFLTDMNAIAGGTTVADVNARKDAFTLAWLDRPDFRQLYEGLSEADFLDGLAATAGVTLPNRAQLLADLVTHKSDPAAYKQAQARVLRVVIENPVLVSREFNPAFVLMQYFGYLQRDPEPAGYNMWLTYLINTGDFRTMINGFVYSIEYQSRFGTP